MHNSVLSEVVVEVHSTIAPESLIGAPDTIPGLDPLDGGADSLYRSGQIAAWNEIFS